MIRPAFLPERKTPLAVTAGLSAQLTRRPPAPQADLVAELLSYAAQAEQEIADQRSRIAYLETLSRTDELTGIANRRAFESFLSQALDAARRHGECGIVGYFDLDDFKSVNDRFGHAAGDAVLRHVAQALAGGIRSFDQAARVGGDEFAVVLVRTSPSGGARRLRALRQALDETLVAAGGSTIAVRASLGVQGFGPHSNRQELLAGADRAMYQDKRLRKTAA